MDNSRKRRKLKPCITSLKLLLLKLRLETSILFKDTIRMSTVQDGNKQEKTILVRSVMSCYVILILTLIRNDRKIKS